jgi:hypothetical protein
VLNSIDFIYYKCYNRIVGNFATYTKKEAIMAYTGVIEFIRHAASTPGELEEHLRPITEEGVLAAQRFGNKHSCAYDLLICSPNLRTRQTLQAMCGENAHIVTLAALWYSEESAAVLNEGFKKLGHAPLRDYLNDSSELFDALYAYGFKTHHDLTILLARHNNPPKVRLCGHGLLLPALLFQMAKSSGQKHAEEFLKEFLSVDLSNCDGWRITLTDGVMTDCERIN